jgi:hypothetical protein
MNAVIKEINRLRNSGKPEVFEREFVRIWKNPAVAGRAFLLNYADSLSG